MNKHILNTVIQDFIISNIDSDISKLLLKGISFEGVSTTELIEQIEAKNKAKTKLPTWYKTTNIYYPNKLNIEQTSSEVTAEYKARLVSGDTLIDLTGGLGVDAYYFSKRIANVTHCEINSELSEIAKHNFSRLDVDTITCYPESGLDVLKQSNTTYDWIYLDPSRRDDSKSKVFLLEDCTPNLLEVQDDLFTYADRVMVKTSPLLDITATIKSLDRVEALHVVAVNNEVKELLWLLNKHVSSHLQLKTINIRNDGDHTFDFNYSEEGQLEATYSQPLTYLYEPNSAVLKSGAFHTVSNKLNVFKLHQHSHLYTSESLSLFPGRRFIIESVTPYKKKQIKSLRIGKANITTRNFPINVAAIRKQFGIKDGGDVYLFFTTNMADERIVIKARKVAD